MRRVHPSNQPTSRGIVRDESGLSTMEYTVLFVIVVVGALGVWAALSRSAQHYTAEGHNQFSKTLSEITGAEHSEIHIGLDPATCGSDCGGEAQPAPQQPIAPPPTTPTPDQPRQKRALLD